MNKRRLRNVGRQKALFGAAESGAILAAAGINVAGTMAASAINANATKKAAQDQAKATVQAAQRQAQAIKEQTERSRDYQMQSQDFIKQENIENRDLQRDIQMQLQMLTGQQNVNDRLEASKIKVKAGGKTKKLGLPQTLLGWGNMPQTLLRGGNMPFRVTDGGGVLPIGITPEGFDLYEIVGNDHEHYHRTRGGKYKSGVGIRFADGNIVEAEGDQRRRARNGGELMLVTPDIAYFISKHNINGINPKGLVERGMHPLQAFAIQEEEKDAININDDGTEKAKYGKKKFLIGGTPNIYNYVNAMSPQIGTDTIGDSTVGIVYGTQNRNNPRMLRLGGKVRVKAKDGWWTRTYNKAKTWTNKNADLVGAGINTLGNIGGAWITSSANRSAANTLANAYNKGAAIMADAYRNMRTIDMNSLRREDYRAAHTMPVLQAPVSFADAQIVGTNRSLQRRLRNAGRYSMSSAAAQDRMANAEVEAQDQRNRIYSADQQQMQDIRQKNAERISEASRVNATLDTEANKQFGQTYLNLLQYNNDIENQKILGSAGAISEGAINGAGAIAQGQTSSAQAWANAVSNSGLTFSNTLSAMAKRKADIESALLGSTMGARVNYIAANGTRSEKDKQIAAIQQALKTENLSPEDKATYEYYLSILK